MTKRRRTDNKMAKRRRTDNTMTKRKRTDNTMTKRRRTDNTMAKRKRGKVRTTIYQKLHRTTRTTRNSGGIESESFNTH
jgi:hypothetical protein